MTEVRRSTRPPQERGVPKINVDVSPLVPESGLQQSEHVVSSTASPSVLPMESSHRIRQGARAVQQKAMDTYRAWSGGEDADVWMKRQVEEEGKSYEQIARELQERGFQVTASNLGKRVAPRLGISKRLVVSRSRFQEGLQEEKAQQRRDLVAWADKTGFLTSYNFTPHQIKILNRIDSGETHEKIAKAEGVTVDAVRAVEAGCMKKIKERFELEEYRKKAGFR